MAELDMLACKRGCGLKAAPPDIVSASPQKGRFLLLEYENGETRRFDAQPYFALDSHCRLNQESYFNQVSVAFDGWFVAWPEGEDIAQDDLYELSVPVAG